MGLLKKIGKAIGGVFKGIKKIFKAIMKPIGKILGSKWGKVLMLGLSIFTLGSSLLAGRAGFLAAREAGKGYISSFVAGGKAFIGSLLGIEPTQQAAAGAPGTSGLPQPVAGTGGGVAPQDIINAPAVPAAPTQAAAGAMGPPASLAGPASVMGPPASLAGPAKASGGWLSKAAKGALDFAKTPSGGTIIGSLIAGIGQGINQKNQNEFDSRIARQYLDPNDPGVQQLNALDFNVDVPGGFGVAPGRLAQAENERSGRFTPHVPFRGLPATMPPPGG